MSEPKEVRRMLGEIRGALDAHSREQLVEILSYVFKEYVVEGAAPLASGAGAILDARSELEGMTFAQLMTWLQAHLDLPELRMFDVAGERVSLRSGGRSIPIAVQDDAQVAQAVQMAVTPTPAVATRPLNVGAPAPAAPPAEAAPAAAPARNAAAPNAPAPSAAAPNAPAAPNAQPQPAAPNAQPQQKDEKDTAANSRFSLLEVD
jgi:hypothetical protein